MEVRIDIDQSDPPVGRVLGPDGQQPGVPFSGWLGLLRALSDLLDAPVGEEHRD